MVTKQTPKVVVKFTPMVLEHRSKRLFVARVKEIGLSAYGKTREDALTNLRDLFLRFVTDHRKAGTLSSVLEKSGLKWSWFKDHPKGEAYEDLTQKGVAFARTSKIPQAAWDDLAPRPLAIAA
jgi:hypothetical protein